MGDLVETLYNQFCRSVFNWSRKIPSPNYMILIGQKLEILKNQRWLHILDSLSIAMQGYGVYTKELAWCKACNCKWSRRRCAIWQKEKLCVAMQLQHTGNQAPTSSDINAKAQHCTTNQTIRRRKATSLERMHTRNATCIYAHATRLGGIGVWKQALSWLLNCRWSLVLSIKLETRYTP